MTKNRNSNEKSTTALLRYYYFVFGMDEPKIIKKRKSLNLAKNNYEEIQRLFNLLYNKTADEKAKEGADAISLMLGKIEQRITQGMGSIIIELFKE